MTSIRLRNLRTAMEDHLNECPEDWDTRWVLADLLDDLGEESLAVGQRWQAAERKRPMPSDDEYGWFDAAEYPPGGFDPESDLPPPLFARLPTHAPSSGRFGAWARWYPDRPTAEEALARALHP
jgi:hypothetical protein